MAFVVEQIKSDSEIVNSTEHKRALEIKGGAPIFKRLADHHNHLIFYCIFVNGNQERPPGKYLLFYKENLIQIDAYKIDEWVEGVGNTTTYLIYSIGTPAEVQNERDQIIQIMTDAFNVDARNWPRPPVVVNVKFKYGGANV